MKKLLTAGAVVLAFTFGCFANTIYVPFDQAVKRSDLIIVGSLREITETASTMEMHGKGTIVVERVIAGNVTLANGVSLKAGDRLPLSYIENSSCDSGSHRRIENEKGFLLLTVNDDGEISSIDFYPLGALAEIKRLFKKGIKPDQTKKTIVAPKTIVKITLLYEDEMPIDYDPSVVTCIYSDGESDAEYYPFAALFILLGAGWLYYFLYRSRFKIR